MVIPIYPTLAGLAINVKWSPEFFNQSQKAINGANIDIALAATPLWNFEINYTLLRDFAVTFPVAVNSEFRRLLGFYMIVGGSAGRFLFNNPEDNIVTGQLLGQGDGTTTVFTAVRTMGAADYGYGFSALTEPVGQVNTGAGGIQTFVNGVPTSATLSTTTPVANTFTFASAPGPGLPVTANFSFYYYCKFKEDTLTFEKIANLYWQNQSVKFQSCRQGA